MPICVVVLMLCSLLLVSTAPGMAQDAARLGPDNVGRLQLFNAVPASQSPYEGSVPYSFYRYRADSQAILLDGSGGLTPLLYWNTVQNKYYYSDSYQVGASPGGTWLLPSEYHPDSRETLLFNTQNDTIRSLFQDRLAGAWFYDEEQYVVTLSGDGLLQLWDLETATQLAARNAELDVPEYSFRDGLASYPSELYANQIRNPQTGDPYTPSVFEDYVTSLEWHDDVLLTLTSYGTLQSWDMASQTMLASTQLCFEHPFDWSRSLVFSLQPSQSSPERIFVQVQQRSDENCFATVELATWRGNNGNQSVSLPGLS